MKSKLLYIQTGSLRLGNKFFDIQPVLEEDVKRTLFGSDFVRHTLTQVTTLESDKKLPEDIYLEKKIGNTCNLKLVL